jgi:(heptosyl)LPS beta-1,4-glucosyltransferase
MLDADERLTQAGRAELLACEPGAKTCAFSVPRKNFFCGRWIRGAGWWPDRLVRLFRTGAARIASPSGSAGTAVHERWEVDGAVTQLVEPIEHYSYLSVAEYRTKFARYTALEALGRTGRASFGSLAAAGALMPLRAAWLLFVRGGVLDGWRGAYVSVGSACYPVAARWKAWKR